MIMGLYSFQNNYEHYAVDKNIIKSVDELPRVNVEDLQI